MSHPLTQTPPMRCRTFAEAEEVLAERLPRYEPRPHQQDLAAAIETEFFGRAYDEDLAKPLVFEYDETITETDAEGRRFVLDKDGNPDYDITYEVLAPRAMFAHAPTGLGKSMAYLIPAILSGKRVIVSVTTKGLQDQLATQDLPFLREHLGEFTWAVLKGRSNYLCLNRATSTPEGEVPGLERILAWVAENPTFSGLREDLPFPIEDRYWSMICGNSDECTAMDCSKPDDDGCYVYRARGAALKANLVVVNHALYFTDLVVREKTHGNANLLGDFAWTVFDEAHEVHEVASSALSTDLSEGTFSSMAGHARGWVQRYGATSAEGDLGEPLEALVSRAAHLFSILPTDRYGNSLRIRGSHLDQFGDAAIALLDAVDAAGIAFAKAQTHPNTDGEVAGKRKKAVLQRMRNAREALMTLLTADLSEIVRWTEVDTFRGKRKVKIRMSPVDISPYLRRHLFSRTATLMVSATLAVKGNFTFQAEQLGVDNYTGKIVGTPFDYKANTRLYVPLLMDAPNQKGWESQATNEIKSLIESAEGRTLVLFTSVAQMRRTFDALRTVVPYPMKMQGMPGESVGSLKEWFLSSEETVLFGSKSFMTGFDARGASCSQVIITKMPFPVPDEPLTEARCEVIEAAGGSAFADYSVPVMSLILQQAVGRLMRHTTDRGVVSILDHRMVTKGYGKQIVRDLPPMTLTHERTEVDRFLADTRAYYAQAGA